MKRIIILLLISTMILTGCGNETENKTTLVEKQIQESERFVIDEKICDEMIIIRDTKTNVQYLSYIDIYTEKIQGICPLYDENGEISIKGE